MSDICGAGCVALKNHNPRSPSEQNHGDDLAWCTENEEKWFAHHSGLTTPYYIMGEDGPEKTELGRRFLGIHAMIKRLDDILCDHLNQEWLPTQIKQHTETRDRILVELEALGKDPADLKIQEVETRAREVLAESFLPNVLDSFVGRLTEGLFPENFDADQLSSHFERVRARVAFKTQLQVKIVAVPEEVRRLFRNALDEKFSSDTTGDVQLHRLNHFKDALDRRIGDSLNEQTRRFQNICTTNLHSLCEVRGLAMDSKRICNVYQDCLMEFILLPLLEHDPNDTRYTGQVSLPFLSAVLVGEQDDTIFVEHTNQANQRALKKQQLQEQEQVLALYRQLLTTSAQ